MFNFTPGHSLYRNSGLILLLLQFSIFVFGLPPFESGIWLQTEPVMLALFCFAAANSAWLFLGIIRAYLIRRTDSALWTCLLAWTGWQLLATILAASPWRSWFGPPEMGEGAGWHIALLLMVMLAYPLWEVKSYRRIITATAAINLAVQCLLQWFNPSDANGEYIPGSSAPAQFGAYLAFMAGSLWIVFSCAEYIKRAGEYAALIATVVAVLIVSHNRSAEVLFCAAMLMSVCAFAITKNKNSVVISRKWRMVAIACCLLPLGWAFFSFCAGPYLPDKSSSEWSDLFSQRDKFLGSRIPLNQVAIATMQHEPRRWLVGDGWGRFTDDVFTYALVGGVHAFADGQRAPNWSLLDGSAYHSHNQAMEALLSLGLPGLLLWVGLPMLALWRMREDLFWPCAPMLVALVVLSGLWFAFPQCVPYQALMWAALCSVCGGAAQQKGAWNKKNSVLAALAVLAFAMIWSAWQQKEAIGYGHDLHTAIMQERPYDEYPVERLSADFARGGDRFMGAATGYAMRIASKKSISANDRGWYARFMEAAHNAAQSPNAGPRLAATELWLQYKLLEDFGGFRSFAELGHQAVLDLPESVLQVCRRAPLRDDLATMFLLNLPDVTHQDAAQQITILHNILSAAPNHRPALWLLGGILRHTPGREEEGRVMLLRAVSLGVGDVYPVTQQEIAPFR